MLCLLLTTSYKGEYEDIKKIIEITYKRWIDRKKRYEFTIYVNGLLEKFNLRYRLINGKLEKNEVLEYQDVSNKNVNDIKISKGEKLFTAFDTYTIIGQKAQGGNGKVYKASDIKGREVAIKVVFREQGEKFDRFRNELNFCEKNSNDNIIKIIDRGAIKEGMIFYVMPFAQETLRERMKKKISAQDAEEIFINILKGLKYAHEKGAYHRDIKPENILFMDKSNNAVIADFGIAHFCEEDMAAKVKTKATDRLANFQYAAPEQRKKGNSNMVDGRADVYSVGLILNEMITGELVGAGRYKKISEVVPEFAYLDTIFENLYCQNPDDRLYPVDNILTELNTLKQNRRLESKLNGV